MRYANIVSNAKRLDKTIFDLTNEDFTHGNYLILVNKIVVLGDSNNARCIINNDGTLIPNKLAEKKLEHWLKEYSDKDINWMCDAEKMCKAFGAIVVNYY